MKNLESIEKSSWLLHQSVKDSLVKNVVASVKGKKINIDENTLEKLLSLLDASADEGYHRGHKLFINTVKSTFNNLLDLEKPPIQFKKNSKL